MKLKAQKHIGKHLKKITIKTLVFFHISGSMSIFMRKIDSYPKIQFALTHKHTTSALLLMHKKSPSFHLFVVFMLHVFAMTKVWCQVLLSPLTFYKEENIKVELWTIYLIKSFVNFDAISDIKQNL